MAFEFKKEHPSGVEVTYWELISAHLNLIQKSATWQLGGWVSEKAKADGKEPLAIEEFRQGGEDYPLKAEEKSEAEFINLFEKICQADARFQEPKDPKDSAEAVIKS